MKIELIDDYEIHIQDKEIKEAVFTDHLGNKHTVPIDNELKIEFTKRRREKYIEEHIERKYLDKYFSDISPNKILANNGLSTEDETIEQDIRKTIIAEIWKLPTPQNRRVYMKLIDEFSYTEIARIEGKSFASVKESIEWGLKKLKKNKAILKLL